VGSVVIATRAYAPIQIVRLARGRVWVMIVARTSTGRTVVHTPLPDVRALSTEHCHRQRLHLVSEGK
jgi:hypothetical protein